MTDITAAIQGIQAQLASLGGDENTFIEVRDNGLETVLGGNRTGLLRIALLILDLADKGTNGSHVHIDQHSLADVAERSLVVRVALANEA